MGTDSAAPRPLHDEVSRAKCRPPHHEVYARIGPSRVHGVGVVAIRETPRGTLVFRSESGRVRWVSRAAVRRLPAAIRALRCIRKGEERTADYRTFVAEAPPFRPRRRSS